jgi:imidazolonepropionase
MNDTTFLIHAAQLLTMPERVDALREYDPRASYEELAARDREIAGAIDDAGLYIKDGKIAWFGPWAERPESASAKDIQVVEADLVTPGWVDCHTHAVFAGERADEFMMRNAGKPYVEILEAGGGILNSVDQLRRTSTRDLADLLFERVFESVRMGVTTLEVKSGYGLSVADEMKSLKAVKMVAERDVPCELVPCFLGAHAVPREFRDRREEYVDLVCDEMIPQVAEQELAAYCDVFCDRGAFTVDEARRILETGQEHGLIARVHADELSDAGAARLAAEVGAASADHLEFTSDDATAEMARAGVVGVLMPAVNLFLGTTGHLAPARKLLNAGCEVAVATDFNPGSAMTQDLGLMLTLACTLYKMTPAEALRAATIGAARALRRDDLGRIRTGHTANLTLLAAPSMSYVPYHFGANHVCGVIQNGQFAYWTDRVAI